MITTALTRCRARYYSNKSQSRNHLTPPYYTPTERLKLHMFCQRLECKNRENIVSMVIKWKMRILIEESSTRMLVNWYKYKCILIKVTEAMNKTCLSKLNLQWFIFHWSYWCDVLYLTIHFTLNKHKLQRKTTNVRDLYICPLYHLA
mgnify:CR=1 FL=1